MVGYATTADGQRAFIWDSVRGMRDLGSYLEALGVSMTGWRLDAATGISADGTVIVGYGRTPSAEMGAWVARVPRFCYANCDGSTSSPVINVEDFVCFQQRFVAEDPYANCDGSTSPPVINVEDYVCFQQRFVAGCS